MEKDRYKKKRGGEGRKEGKRTMKRQENEGKAIKKHTKTEEK